MKQKLFSFISKLLSPDGDVSSKRWMGINIIYYIMLVYLVTFLLYGFSDWHKQFMENLFYGALALMGLTALDKIVGIFKK